MNETVEQDVKNIEILCWRTRKCLRVTKFFIKENTGEYRKINVSNEVNHMETSNEG